jgi:transposase
MAWKSNLVVSPTVQERQELRRMTRPSAQHRFLQRAKVILMSADGRTYAQIRRETGLSKMAISKWRKRFASKGIEGLNDLPRCGAPRKYGQEEVLKIINTACSSTKEPYTRWSVRRIADASGTGMRKSRVHDILKGLDLKPHQYRMWLFPNEKDPEFERKEAEICGLYVNPPENSVVLCVDEKPAIQARERLHQRESAETGIPERIDFNYKRHGVLNLFAAFSVHDGEVLGKVSERKKAPDFLEFLKDIYSRWSAPSRTLHIIADNYGTHTSHLVAEWLAAHPDVVFHFTPSHGSWLNQVELWFSILSRQALKRGDFQSKEDLAKKLVGFIEDYNQRAKPFAWTYEGRPLMIA